MWWLSKKACFFYGDASWNKFLKLRGSLLSFFFFFFNYMEIWTVRKLYIIIFWALLEIYKNPPIFLKRIIPNSSYLDILEDLPEARDHIEEWREKVKDIHADGATWWWWWYIYIHMDTVTRIQTLDKAVCISHSTIT